MMDMGSNSPGEPIDIPIVPNNSLPPNVRIMGPGGPPATGMTGRRQQSLGLIMNDSLKRSPTGGPVTGRRMSIDEIKYEQCRLEPKIENRIVIINDEVLKPPAS